MQPPKSETCVICGVRIAETVDHVPPKGFFRGVENAQLRTVPACHTCNNGASSDDEDVRFFISAQIGKQNPASKKLWEDGAHKTILRKTKLREALSQQQERWLSWVRMARTLQELRFVFPSGPINVSSSAQHAACTFSTWVEFSRRP